ncbi:MAG: hypothetical protein E7541_06295 [Ruminococcaceae bacterium]|nr:hypothetical protein [Oscillospiraceae bacterium]
MAKEKEKFDFVQPFKDIPGAFKGFPMNLVRMAKDPVKSSAEVKERKKAVMPWMYLFSMLTIVFVVLAALVDALSFLPIISVLGIAYCGFMLWVLKMAARKYGDIECDACKTLITFGDNVKYEVTNKRFEIKREEKKIEKNGIPVEATIKAMGIEHITVAVACKCQACGAEKSFNHDFVSIRCNKIGVKVPYVQSGALLIQYESDVNDAYNSGVIHELGEVRPKSGELQVGGKSASSVTVGNAVEVTLHRSAGSLVEGYFGNELNA